MGMRFTRRVCHIRTQTGGKERVRKSKLISSIALSAITVATIYFAVLSLLVFFGVFTLP
jgi:hypothetical protein